MYKLFQVNGETVSVNRLSDGASIPCSEDNADYQQYLKWLAEGNTPLPPDEAKE